MAKLKVYRTPIGFHDAYVAAPSQKAALKAWGAEADLFARGSAEPVTDAQLMAEPLARPGEVIRVSRGLDSEHFEALAKQKPRKVRPADNARAARAREAEKQPPAKAQKKAPPARPIKPRPSREALDTAEQALSAAEADYEVRRKDIVTRIEALRAEERALKIDHAGQMAELQDAKAKAHASYQREIQAWAAD